MNISNDEFWIVTQICDSGFPGGALAHSQGLESALSHGLISINDETENELIKFVNLSIIQANNQLIPILLNAWKVSYNCNDDDDNDWFNNIKIIDEKCQLVLNNNVSIRSSVNQGKCFLRASKEAFFNNTNTNDNNTKNHEKIQQLSKIIQMKTDDHDNNKIHGHYPTIFGLVCGLLNISELITKKIFFRCFVRDLFSSAYRLNIIGPLEGANLQAIVCKNLERNLLMNDNYSNDNINDNNNDNNNEYISKKRKANDIDDNIINNHNHNITQVPVTTVPILEILQGRHDLLYCRLFNS